MSPLPWNSRELLWFGPERHSRDKQWVVRRDKWGAEGRKTHSKHSRLCCESAVSAKKDPCAFPENPPHEIPWARLLEWLPQKITSFTEIKFWFAAIAPGNAALITVSQQALENMPWSGVPSLWTPSPCSFFRPFLSLTEDVCAERERNSVGMEIKDKSTGSPLGGKPDKCWNARAKIPGIHGL